MNKEKAIRIHSHIGLDEVVPDIDGDVAMAIVWLKLPKGNEFAKFDEFSKLDEIHKIFLEAFQKYYINVRSDYIEVAWKWIQKSDSEVNVCDNYWRTIIDIDVIHPMKYKFYCAILPYLPPNIKLIEEYKNYP